MMLFIFGFILWLYYGYIYIRDGDITTISSEGKKMPKKHAPTGRKLQKPLGKKISYSQ